MKRPETGEKGDMDRRPIGHGPDYLGDDEQETEVAEYEQFSEDPPEDYVIEEDEDNDAEAAEDWSAAHPWEAGMDTEPADRSAEGAAVHEIPG